MSDTPQFSDAPATQPGPGTGTLPIENVQRGTVLALVIIPAGIIVWVILWSIGFIASIVAFGVAFGALALYKFGSGGRVSLGGAIRVTVITVVTLVLSFVAGLASDGLPIWMQQHRQSLVEALVDPSFWSALSRAAANSDIAIQLLLALVFGVLGCFTVLRAAFVQARVGQPVPGNPGAVYGQASQQTPVIPPALMQSDPGAPPVPSAPPAPPAPPAPLAPPVPPTADRT